MRLNWHEEHEIIKITKGKYYYEIGTEKGIANPGDILYVNSGTIHSIRPEQEDGCEFYCIIFDLAAFVKYDIASGRMLKKLIDENISIFLRLSDCGNAQINFIIQELFDLLSANGNKIKIHGLLLQLFGEIIHNGYYDKKSQILSKSQNNVLKLKKSLSFMENNYNTPITLKMIADEANMNPEYFCKFFKKMTNFTPIEYLNKYRVEIACYNLIFSDLSITELAYECGFNELSYFICVFKKFMEITPKQYYLTKCGKKPPAS